MKWIKPARTAIQAVISLVPVVPFLIPAIGLSATTGVGATIVVVAAGAARLMQIPAVESFLEKYGLKSPEA